MKLQSLKCKICGKKYSITDSNKVRFQKRFQDHCPEHQLMETDCGCGISFKSYKKRLRHQKTEHEGKFECPECGDALASEESLKSHIENIHRIKLQCPQCPLSFSGKGKQKTFEDHILMRHAPKEIMDKVLEIFPCKYGCKQVFKSLKGVEGHNKREHSVRKPCPECGKEFSYRYLNEHISNMHKTEEEKHKRCDQCGKGFGQTYDLNQHKAIVHEGKRFYCRFPECEKKEQPYRDSSNRDSHEKKKHGGTFLQYKALSEQAVAPSVGSSI